MRRKFVSDGHPARRAVEENLSCLMGNERTDLVG